MKIEMPIDISMIVPVFNGGTKIRRCVDALARQVTRRRYEVIIVDDGSTDSGLEGLASESADRPVRVFRQANQGPAVARNLGVSVARGKFVLFTDADCEPVEDWLEEMMRPMEENPSVVGVKGAYLTRQQGIVSRFVQLEYESKYERMKKDQYIDFIDTYSAGFVKEDFRRVGCYDTRFPTASVEDQEFSFRMWEAGCRMVFNPKAKVYHTHSGSLGNYLKKKFRIGYWKTLVLKRHPGKIVRDSHTPQTLKLEMAFAVLFWAGLVMWPFVGAASWLVLAAVAGFGASIAPFVRRIFGRDKQIALYAPFLLFVRAQALSAGLIAGVVQFTLGSGTVINSKEKILAGSSFFSCWL